MKLLIIYTVIIVAFLYPMIPADGNISIPIIGYLDEILAVVSTIYIVFHYNTLHIYEKAIIKLCILLLLVGLVGTLKYEMLTKLFPITLDMLACVKAFVVFVWANHYVGSISIEDRYAITDKIGFVLAIFLSIGFVFSILNLVSDIGMSNESRLGLRCFKYIYPKSANLSNSFYLFLLFLTTWLNHNTNYLRKLIILMALVVWALTIKSRAMFFIVMYIGLYFWIVVKQKGLQNRLFLISFFLISLLSVSGDRIEETYSNEAAPRTLLLYGGIETMKNCFPIGAGFGTYGTDVACKYYSPLYYQYGFQNAYGLNPDDTQYAHDCFWPAIMGEYGVIGVILVCIILWNIARYLINIPHSPILKMLTVFLLLSQALASIPTSLFFQNSTVFLLFLLPLMHTEDDEVEYITNNEQ